MNFNDYTKRLHNHFGIAYDGNPRFLDRVYMAHKYGQLQEEMDEILFAIKQGNLEGIVDGLADLSVFALGTIEQMGVDVDAVMGEVLRANLDKELGKNPKRNTHELDLIKPEGWQEPYLKDLVDTKAKHKGIIILEGTDCSGKSTIAEYLVKEYNALLVHHTWNERLEQQYDRYMFDSLSQILGQAKHSLVVVDRAWISEVLYAKVYRGGTRWQNIQRFMQPTLKMAGAKTIFCKVHDYEKHNERYQKSKEAGNELYEDVSKVTRLYNQVWDVGIQGLGDGSPVRTWEGYKEYSIDHDGSNMEQYVDVFISDNF